MSHTPNAATQPLVAALETLRGELLKLEPSGPSGFEGLVATALAELTGLTFRLAKSGSQFGRDGSTPRARFAIAMEAKRYRDPLRLEDIAGKIWLASNELTTDVDLWTLCATSEMGDSVLSKLQVLLEQQGISLLVLDWTAAPLPRLAVLLAGAQHKVVQWFASHVSSPIAEMIDGALSEFAHNSAFFPAQQHLKNEASSSYVGLAALSRVNEQWTENAFSDKSASRVAFGQFLTVAAPTRPAIARPALDARFAAALSAPQSHPRCVAVLGAEGAGKSWLVARWWSEKADRPILVISTSKMISSLHVDDPIKTLANLLALQESGDFGVDSGRWERRLRRWRNSPRSVEQRANENDQPRFIFYVDGINERSGLPWADIIVRLSIEAQALDGRLVVTCRERYWDREVAPRLAGVDVDRVMVGDFAPGELNAVLRQRNLTIDSVPEGVRVFIRNPRICTIALDLIDRITAQADELTIERLLLEYWRRRLEERGDLVAHDVRDFEKLLKSHAAQFRKSPGVQFDRDDWRQHSGAAQRGDGRSVQHDLTDIEEGAFLQVVDGREGFYEFKRETVPFALGLLVARELQDELRKPEVQPSEAIDGIIEEVQGFDLVGDALRSAAGISCFEADYPHEGRVSLLSAWLDLQNIPDSSFDSLIAYAAVRPDAVLDTLESSYEDRASARRRRWPLDALIEIAGRPPISTALRQRIARWLSRWSRLPRGIGFSDEHEEKRFREGKQRIAEKLENLTSAESEVLAKCEEVKSPQEMQIDSAASLLMAAQARAEHAEDILAWAFVSVLTDDFQRADNALAWVIRINPYDFGEFQTRLNTAIDKLLGAPHSEVGRLAAAQALRLLGTVEGATKADQIDPPMKRQRWRRVERYCETDPFDPGACRPENILNAVNLAQTIDASKVWTFIYSGEHDFDIEMITPGLARFEPKVIVTVLRDIAAEAQTRRGLALRQLSWHLPQLSPLFDQKTLDAVQAGLNELIQQPQQFEPRDLGFVAGCIFLSLLPHLDATQQLELYLSLPKEVSDWYEFRPLFSQLLDHQIEAALIQAEGDPIRLRRTLFFISIGSGTLSHKATELVGRALLNEDRLIVAFASDVAYYSHNPGLDAIVISAARKRRLDTDSEDEAFWRDRAVARAVVSCGEIEDIRLFPPRLGGFSEGPLGQRLKLQAIHDVDTTIKRLLTPVKAVEPRMGRLLLETGVEGSDPVRRVEDRAIDDNDGKLRATVSSEEQPEARQFFDGFMERQEALHAEARSYLKQLSAEGALALAREPDIRVLRLVVGEDLKQGLAWADAMLAETESSRLSSIKNLALSLAEAIAAVRPQTAADLLTHVSEVESPITLVSGDARIPLDIQVLFAGASSGPMSALRSAAFNEAMTDAAIETLVFAAEHAHCPGWLEEWIELEAASSEPSRIARALTIDGFRSAPSKLLRHNWGSGFLAEVAKKARSARDRNDWARHWASEALSAESPDDFWRWGELSAGVADVRACRWFRDLTANPLTRKFSRHLFKRIKENALKRSKKRREILFGVRAPDYDLAKILQSGFKAK